jgi:hypothetical protein
LQLKENTFYNKIVKKFSLPIIIAVLAVIVGAAYLSLNPDMLKKEQAPVTSSSTASEQKGPTPKPRNAIEAIKAYAAMQFNVTVDEIKILSSEKRNWKDICLDIKIKNYDCKKSEISGSQAVVEANGIKTTYRSNEDGSIIRVVK